MSKRIDYLSTINRRLVCNYRKMNKSDTVAVIRSLLSSSKYTYSIFNLNNDFKNETGVDIPLFGYASVSDFLHSIPHTVKVTGTHPIQEVSLVTNEKSAHIVSLVKRQRNPEQKKSIPKFSSISRKFAGDTRMFQLPARKTTLKSFKGQYKSFTENDIFASNTGCISKNSDLGASSNSAVVCLEEWIATFLSLNSWLHRGESIPHINVESLVQIGGYVEVRLCQIFSPEKFYFRFRKFKKKFSDFMDKLQVFYTTESIPNATLDVIRPKLICAVFYKIHTKPMWHRAEIHEVINNSEVIVSLIDHGAMVKISNENIKYLYQDFMSLPRQAFLGSLANIRPSKGNSEWSTSAIDRFFDLSFGRDLVAGVVHIDSKYFHIKVALSYTKDLEFHINDTLVKEDFAEFDTDVIDSHFVDILKMTNSWTISNGNHKERELISDGINDTKEFTENDILTPTERNVLPKFRTPVFYFSSNNNRLKKMCSFVEKK